MSRFATKRKHWKYRGLLRSTKRPPGHRAEPVLFRMPAEPGKASAAPVRIYVGSEPLQHRAERVLLWSLEKVRDPAREYQVYLMKDLIGFARNGWKTAFKTYRYAVPSLAGNQGRAIYNDVDQIYLHDPSELFDLDMDGHGVLCIDDRDSSVMLIDCERMADVWREADAKTEQQHKVFRRRAKARDLWGPLPPRWHARDTDYVAGQSGLLHFTTLHKQPWHPFPRELKYEANEVGDIWHTLEAEADAAGFTPWSKAQPCVLQLQKAATGGGSLEAEIARIGALVERYLPSTLLDYGSSTELVYQDSPEHESGGRHKIVQQWPGVAVTCYDPGNASCAAPVSGTYDAVIATDVLEHVPEEDVPWVLDEIFSLCGGFLYLVAACFPARKHLPDSQNARCTVMPPAWWHGQVEAAARRRMATSPEACLHWTLCTREKRSFRPGIRSRWFEGTTAAA
ncbi:MAG: hypothetical protein OXE81_01520 [Gammaproteobacteria bacterium]|nr:hypothetical protein [Gammaproteobacteria bacterium]